MMIAMDLLPPSWARRVVTWLMPPGDYDRDAFHEDLDVLLGPTGRR